MLADDLLLADCTPCSAILFIAGAISSTPGFDVLLYDLTSTDSESDLPQDEADKRRFGYSREKPTLDCVQVVIALVVTPEGLPLADQVLAGNTADNTTKRVFLAKIEAQYGKARRVFVNGPRHSHQAVVAQTRQSDPPVQYLVGTPKGRLSRLERGLLDKPWREADLVCGSSSWRRPRSSTCWPQRLTARPRSAACAGASSNGCGRGSEQLEGDDAHSRGAADEARRVPPAGRARLAPIDVRLAEAVFHSPTPSIATSYTKPAAARDAICCAPISPKTIPPICGP